MALFDFRKKSPAAFPGNTAPSSRQELNLTGDSSDSVVFLTFAPVSRTHWTCPECGTRNESTLNGCVVCGLKK